MNQKIILFSLISCLAFGGTSFPACAQEKEGSMDEVWSDNHSNQNTTSTGSTAPLVSSHDSFSVTKLKSSEFVNLGSWPQIGPFEDTDNKDVLKDRFENKLTIASSEDSITSAQLELSKNQGKFDEKMRVQVALDFLLESLGAKSGDIATINNSIDREFEKVSQEALNLNAGPYQVALAKSNAENQGFSMTVTKAALPEATIATTSGVNTPEQTSTTSTTNTTTSTSWNQTPSKTESGLENTSPSLSDNPQTQVKTTPNGTVYTRTPKTTQTASINPNSSKFSIQTTSPTASTPVKTTAERTPPPTKNKEEKLRQDFENLVVGWQNIRRAVVKNRQTQNLTKILGGKALASQSQAIKWLLDHDMYYEFEPRSLKMTDFRPLTPDTKYEVDISIQERQKKFSAKTMKILTDVEKDYRATYTVEKIRGAWLITDFALHAN
ncbi:MAG: IMS domain-containing protein [Candidatus Obscuribacter sp.]|nr:IMS domain-containing protein [Candidatus Obscuribacter sp.]